MGLLYSSLPFVAIVSLLIWSPCQAFAHSKNNGWGPKVPGTTTSSSLSSSTTTTTSLSSSATNGEAATSVLPDDNVKTADILSLDSIRSTLIRQEETIIFALIERAQFRQNSIVYKKGGMGNLGTPTGCKAQENDDNLSFLEFMLAGTEALHCGVRRYTSPEEHPFFPERLPNGGKGIMDALPELEYPSDLLSHVGGACDLNFNEILLKKYIEVIIPAIAQPGDDEQHGSTVLCDIAVLLALSRRIHYGKFVAESKYRSDPEGYQALVDANDSDGVMALLTNMKVEKQVLRRARLKAATYGTEPLLSDLPPIPAESDVTSIVAAAAASAVVAAIEAMDNIQQSGKVCPATVESIYRDIIIPMTKDIEVAYLFRRCGRDPPPEYASDRMSVDVARI